MSLEQEEREMTDIGEGGEQVEPGNTAKTEKTAGSTPENTKDLVWQKEALRRWNFQSQNVPICCFCQSCPKLHSRGFLLSPPPQASRMPTSPGDMGAMRAPSGHSCSTWSQAEQGWGKVSTFLLSTTLWM